MVIFDKLLYLLFAFCALYALFEIFNYFLEKKFHSYIQATIKKEVEKQLQDLLANKDSK